MKFKPLRIAHVTTVHPRRDVRILHKECASLAAAGHNVTMIVADGLGDERCAAVDIIDVSAGADRGRIWRLLTRPRRALDRLLELRPEVAHLHDPELLTIAAALQSRGIKVIYDAHEDVPRQILTKHWIPGPFRKLVSIVWEFYENRTARRLDGVVGATPFIADRFGRLNGSTINVSNFPLLAEFGVEPTSPRGRRVKPRAVCYVGGITETRGIRQVVEALPLVPDCELILCGPIVPESFGTELRALPGWKQVDYRGVVDRDGVRRAMADSSCGVVTLLPMANFLDSLPVKMFEYMAAGLPVIASDFPLWRGIIEEVGCGLCVDPQSPTQIAQAITRILDDPNAGQQGAAGRHAVVTRYNWQPEADKLREFYAELA